MAKVKKLIDGRDKNVIWVSEWFELWCKSSSYTSVTLKKKYWIKIKFKTKQMEWNILEKIMLGVITLYHKKIKAARVSIRVTFVILFWMQWLILSVSFAPGSM